MVGIRSVLTCCLATGALLLGAPVAQASSTSTTVREDVALTVENTCNGEVVELTGTSVTVTRERPDGRVDVRTDVDARGSGDRGNPYRMTVAASQRFDDGDDLRIRQRIVVRNRGAGPDLVVRMALRVEDGEVTLDVTEERCRG
jgi:hypothetical protein